MVPGGCERIVRPCDNRRVADLFACDRFAIARRRVPAYTISDDVSGAPLAFVRAARGGLLILRDFENVGSLIAVVEAPRTWAREQRQVIGNESGAGFAFIRRPGDWRGGGRWIVTDHDGNELLVAERSSWVPLFLREVVERLFLQLLPLPYVFALRAGDRRVRSFARRRTIRRRSVLDLTGGAVDQRTALALAIVIAEAEYRVDETRKLGP